MLNQPFERRLQTAQHVLVAGMGGGFDVYHGLPLYFALSALGKTITLSNLTFTNLALIEYQSFVENVATVTGEIDVEIGAYFPEYWLARWFAEKREIAPTIYALARTGVLPMVESYRRIIEQHNIDLIVWVDGGTDSLMCGYEDGLGTPHEDLLSLAVGSLLEVDQMVLTVGFGVDHYHGVSNDLTLAAIADLTKAGGFLGSLPLLEEAPEVVAYVDAVAFSAEKIPTHPSIVASSIVSSIQGHYGNYHTNERTRGSKLWINPLMSMYFFFDLQKVAQRNLIIKQLYMTEFFDQVIRQIMIFQRLGLKERRLRAQIPN